MNFFRQLFQTDKQETKGEILFFRLFEAIIIYQIIFYAWSWGFYIPQLGDVVLPLGFANYFDVSFMFNHPFSLVNAAFITLFALLGYLKKGKWCYLLALICMHIQYIARFSQGEISHGSNFTAMGLLAFALPPLVFSNHEKQRKVALGLFIFFIGLGYTSAACSKLIGTGLNWIDGRHLYLWIGERATDKLSQNGTFELNFFQELLFEYYWLATITLLFGLVTEFFGFLLWFRKIRWIQATLLIGMHLGIDISMNINFVSYVIILLIIGYPWPRLLDKLLEGKPIPVLDRYLERRLQKSRPNMAD